MPASFRSIHWRTLRGLSAADLARLDGFLVARELGNGEVFSEIDADPPGVMFVCGGWVSIVGRLPNGLVANPLILGRGRMFGEGAYRTVDRLIPSVSLQITGVRNARVAVLPADRIAAAIEAVPRLRDALVRLCLLRAAVVPFCAAMRQSPALSGAAMPALASLVMLAELQRFETGETIVAAGARADSIYLLAQGEARCAHAEANASTDLEPGSVFGSLLAGRKLEQESIVAGEPSVCLRITRKHMRDQFELSPALRRAGAAITGHHEDEGSGRGCFILADGDDRYPTSRLGFFTAATLHALYGDCTAFLTLRDSKARVGAPEIREGVHCEEVRIGPTGAESTLKAWGRAHPQFDYVLIDRAGLPWEWVGELAPILSKVAFVTADSFGEVPLDWRADKIAWCVQVPDATLAGDPAHQYGAMRARFDMDRIRRARTLAELSEADRERFARWARSISERTVGVALGGGGAWGFAHVPLLNMLAKNGIPVDMVTGASFGSLAGSYYCALQRPDWADHLIEGAPAASWALKKAVWSSRSLQQVIDDHLTKILGRTPRLEELEIPLLPVATNVGAGAEAVIGFGTVGFGARCSSSFPGIFTPTTGKGVRYVDGGIVRNVPTEPLAWNGCDFIIASNIVPNPRYEKERDPRVPGPLGRWLHEFNPYRRAQDTLRSSLILMHTASDAVTWNADVLYNSPMIDFSPTDLTKGPEIIEATQASVEAIERRVKSAWRRVREGRGSH